MPASFDSVSVSCRAAMDGVWQLSAACRINREAPVELFLILDDSPLDFLEATCSEPSVHLRYERGRQLSLIRLSRNLNGAEWNEVTLTLELLWRPEAAPASNARRAKSFATPCLVLPDMLPRLVDAQSAVTVSAPRCLPRITFAQKLPDALSAGGVATLSDDGRAATELLQTVIYMVDARLPDPNDLGMVALPTALPNEVLDRAWNFVLPLLLDLKEALGQAAAVRPVVCLTTSDAVFPPSGAYCPLSPVEVGATASNAGRPVNVIRLLTLAWIGGGVRLSGENAGELSLALGGAYGQRWLRSAGETDVLSRTRESMLDRVRAAQRSQNWSMADRIRDIELQIVDGFEKADVHGAIRNLVHAHWGEVVPQSLLIDALRSRGIRVPHVFA